MRALFLALLCFATTLRGEDDLFTGIPPVKVPDDVRNFLAYLSNALNSGEPNTVLNFAITPESTGTGMLFLRQRLAGLNKERKVKKIEMVASVAEADVEEMRGGVKYRPAAKPTHTVVARMEGMPGDVLLIELPVAKVVHPKTKVEAWRIMVSAPAAEEEASGRLAEAKALVERAPQVPNFLIDLGLLHALLGQRKEAEAIEAKLLALAEKKAVNQAPLIYLQMGWMRYHLGDNQRALEAFKKAFELSEGKMATTEIGLAVGYYINGETAQALKVYDHAAGQTPLYSDREALEKYLKTRSPERSVIVTVQTLWLRAFAPSAAQNP